MNYNPHVWTTGEVITAQNLNHMEDSIGTKYVRFVKQTTDEGTVYTTTDTFEDVLQAFNRGKTLVAYVQYSGNFYRMLDLKQAITEEGIASFTFSKVDFENLGEETRYGITSLTVSIADDGDGGTASEGEEIYAVFSPVSPT